MTVTGSLGEVAKGFSLIARTIVEEYRSEIDVAARHIAIRLLVPFVRMGSVMGKVMIGFAFDSRNAGY